MDLYLHFVKARITTKTKMMTTFRERVITVKSSENERERETLNKHQKGFMSRALLCGLSKKQHKGTVQQNCFVMTYKQGNHVFWCLVNDNFAPITKRSILELI